MPSCGIAAITNAARSLLPDGHLLIRGGGRLARIPDLAVPPTVLRIFPCINDPIRYYPYILLAEEELLSSHLEKTRKGGELC